jgi:ERCC4-type nuclease
MKHRVDQEPIGVAESFSFVSPPTTRLLVKREGRNLLRNAGIPKPTVLVDTREQQPLPLLTNHPNWIGGERRAALRTGDYSIEGMEALLALERKSLADLINCAHVSRKRFIAACSRLARFRWKAILVEASYEQIKGGWSLTEIQSHVHPNSVCGLLDAIEAKFGIPVLLTSRHRDLATERAASWLSKHFTYWWLEQNGYGRLLIDTDGL